MKRAQQAIWEFVRAQWDERNKIIHGANEEESKQLERLALKQEVEHIYDNRPAVGTQEEELFGDTIEVILERPNQNLRGWMERIEVAAGAEASRQAREKSNRNKITRWLRPKRVLEALRTSIKGIPDRLARLHLATPG